MSEQHNNQGASGGSTGDVPRLSREAHGRPRAPERIIHLGLGNFTRAHQAWYTEHAPDADRWGIAAFTGRNGQRLVSQLDEQGDVYTLITSAPEGDRFEVISSISSAFPGSEVGRMRRRFANPAIGIVTSTVTEAGYMRDHNGDLDTTNALVAADIKALAANHEACDVQTTPLKVVAGLLSRRKSGAGEIAILPCDNLAGNGAAFRRVVEQAAEQVDGSLLGWMRNNVSWATSMVDRITPATTDAERQAVSAATGFYDAQPVRSEPFKEWVIAGDFPAGHPAWQEAGAVITDDVTPYEQRKLWMLNGAHSTLAYTGSLFGYANVAQAIADPTLRQWVDEWWNLAAPYLSIPSDDYRRKLVQRFSNPRIDHHLEQIASDGSQKLAVRIVPVAIKALADGRSVVPAARAVAAWMLFVRRFAGTRFHDVNAQEVTKLAAANGEDGVRALVAYLDGGLAASQVFVDEVMVQLDAVRKAASCADGAR